jgi:hypothetical protein
VVSPALGTAAAENRRHVWLLVPAVACVVASAWWTSWLGGVWQASGGDYEKDYAPAMNALLGGHIRSFFAHLPVNGAGGSVLLRAPFAALGNLLSGHQLSTFRSGSFACLLALGALGLLLAVDMRRRGLALVACAAVTALFAGTPALLEAVLYGHPEEALGAALSVAAVLLACRGRPVLAGGLLGAALINKPWGIFAVGPVLLCSKAHRGRSLLVASAIAASWLAVAAILDPARLWLSVAGADTAIVAHPQNLWWPLAHMDGLFARPPAFLAAHARQLAVVGALVATAALILRRPGGHARLGEEQCLALLAFGFALRCLLEPSPHDYYELPLIVALATWEVRAHRSLRLSLVVAVLIALDFRRLGEAGATLQYLLFLTVLLPCCSLLLASIFGRSGELRPVATASRQLHLLRRLPRHT